ncbi:hypothetical protein D3C72_1527330 [compost metagenome]
MGGKRRCQFLQQLLAGLRLQNFIAVLIKQQGARHAIDEIVLFALPVFQKPCGLGRAGLRDMPGQKLVDGLIVDRGLFVLTGDRTEQDGIVADLLRQIAIGIILIDETAAHAVAETLAETAKVENGTVGHVFAGEIAHAFDHGGRAGVTHRETVARLTLDESAAASGAEQREIADQHIAASLLRTAARRAYDDGAPAGAFANAVIAGAGMDHDHAVIAESAEGLPGRP